MKEINLENKQLNLKEAKSELTILKSKPTYMWLAVTGRCNLNCSHCPIRHLEKKDKRFKVRDMSQDIFHKIEKEIFPYLEICLLGGNNLGEQFFAKDWDYLFEAISHYCFDIHIITNGTLLNPKRIKELVEREVTISFSIEGFTKELYESIRGDNYEKVINNIKLICQERDKQKKANCRIMFGITLFRDNIYQLPSFIELAKEIGVDEINSNHLSPQYEWHRDQSLVYHKDVYNTIYKQAIEKCKFLGIKIDMPPLFEVKEMNYSPEEDIKTKAVASQFKCFWPWTRVSIDENGLVYPCCTSGSIMGDLKKDSFDKIWNNKKYQRLRKTVNSSKPPDYCRNCVARESGRVSEATLLSAIGPISGFSYKKIILNYIKNYFLKSKSGHKIFPWLEKLYRKMF